jgi:hypothetical protein
LRPRSPRPRSKLDNWCNFWCALIFWLVHFLIALLLSSFLVDGWKQIVNQELRRESLRLLAAGRGFAAYVCEDILMYLLSLNGGLYDFIVVGNCFQRNIGYLLFCAARSPRSLDVLWFAVLNNIDRLLLLEDFNLVSIILTLRSPGQHRYITCDVDQILLRLSIKRHLLICHVLINRRRLSNLRRDGLFR